MGCSNISALEAGELIGESPTTCSFHFRQLEKYGFTEVAALPRLEELYVWGTTVSQPAIDKMKAERKGVTLYAGLTAKDVKVETKVMTPTN